MPKKKLLQTFIFSQERAIFYILAVKSSKQNLLHTCFLLNNKFERWRVVEMQQRETKGELIRKTKISALCKTVTLPFLLNKTWAKRENDRFSPNVGFFCLFSEF